LRQPFERNLVSSKQCWLSLLIKLFPSW
jgi:hypothetical protein